jgi:hypothetical protein
VIAPEAAVRLDGVDNCRFCKTAVYLYRCSSCMKVSGFRSTSEGDRCPRCNTMKRPPSKEATDAMPLPAHWQANLTLPPRVMALGTAPAPASSSDVKSDVKTDVKTPAPGQSLVDFHKSQGVYSKWMFAQGNALVGHPGVCAAFSCVWVIRRLDKSDFSYQASNIAGRLGALMKYQKEYEALKSLPITKRLEKLSQVKGIVEDISGADVDFDAFFVQPQIDGGFKVIPDDKSATDVFRGILTQLLNEKTKGPFIVTYEGANPHMLAIDLREEKIVIFDPNFGEFSFPMVDVDKFLAMMDEAWRLGAKPPGTKAWDAVRVTGN